jgi:predicted TIM-barrel fold metal-dependent hydrolase
LHYEARFVVDPHVHITTLYKPAGAKSLELAAKGLWTGLNGEVEPFDNSPLCLYDMDRYGVDMCLLKPSVIGTKNETQAALVDKYPDKFRAFCSDQTLKIKVWREEAKWTLNDAADEVEKALKTGKYIGIGEFVPMNPDPKHVYTFKERLDEWRTFAELAQKYSVTIDFHDFAWGFEWDPYQLLARITREYPDVPIIFCHAGYSIGGYVTGADVIRKACSVAGSILCKGNIYLETGTWPAEFFEIALKDPNVGAPRLIWGGDYGNVPQYILANPGREPSSFSTGMTKWPPVPYYHIDWWGWALHQIRKIRDWVTQDEINLILGGNAARIFNLPVPYERMFLSGRPDIWGVNWEKTVPYIPRENVINPDK